MSKKSEWNLTEDGVQALYEHDFKDEIKVQVIFKAEGNCECYLRVSDGCHISPIVFITKIIIDKFCVGAVIAIKEKRLVGYDEYIKEEKDRFILKDRGLHRVIIESYVVVAGHTEVGRVLGSLDHNVPYREEIRNTLYALLECNSAERHDNQLAWEQGDEASAINQKEGEALREKGNYYFKQGKYEEAITFYDMAKEKDEYDCRVWSNSSQAHYMLKEYPKAELYAVIAIKMNPFYEKAYYRAVRAALKSERRAQVDMYARSGIFLCRENKELWQILEENSQAMCALACQEPLLSHLEAMFSLTSDFNDINHTLPQKGFNVLKETQQQLMRKRFIDYSSSLGREIKKEMKKTTKKPKKPGNEAAAGSGKEQERSREEEKKHAKESKKQKDHKLNLNEALQEGRRLYETDQFHQAIEMYNKYLTSIVSADKINSNKGKSNEGNEVQVIHFIIGMCKVQSSRGYIYDGLETMEFLCDENSKFPNKPAARYWLAVSYEKICCFESALRHAQECKDALMKTKSIKPVKWPKTDQPINITLPDVLEKECKLLLDKPSSARPSPKAKCRYKKCISTQGIKHAKEQIYLTDPDFKGYLNVMCEEDCTVSYHPCCWKAYKEQHDSSVNRMSDKDFLGLMCVTPDCTGKISSIQIYDDAGELKNEVVKDKKERKHLAAPVKQKKKKDKKKEKMPVQKKRNRAESVCEDHVTNEETSPVGAESTGPNTSTPTNTNNCSNNNNTKRSQPVPMLPIDPESLENVQVTILKPGAEAQPPSPIKAAKKNKKKKAKKPFSQPNLLADPLETDICIQNEYVARLRALQQQRDALEADESPTAKRPLSSIIGTQKPVMLLDPENPFYLPRHLQDNPEELENILQKQLTNSTPTGLQQETINTLLDFMYDWLKSEGPMHTSDPRLAEQVAESFPPEAQEYVSHCGGITGLLMQSIKFAMIDSIICVHDDVMKAEEKMCREVSEKMTHSKYLIHFSDGKKARRFTHLLDDAKSTCSTASSSSLLASSVADSFVSRDSSAYNTRWHNGVNINSDSTASLVPLSKNNLDQYFKSNVLPQILNPTAPTFEPVTSNHLEEEDNDDEEVGNKWSNGDCDYIKNWAAQAGEEVPLIPDEEEEEEEEEEQGEEEEEEQEEGEEEATDSQDEDVEQYVSQLQEEKETLTQDLKNEQQQNQVLSDKLFQVKSQYKSEVMKLKQQLEELKDQNKDLNAEKNAILSQKEVDIKKYKSDLSKCMEDMKTHQSRSQSLSVKCDCLLDQKNELEAKLAEEMEINSQMKEELEKMKNLQESLTSCSRRAREAEVKYLSTKKDLVEASMSRTIKRLTEEATVMRQLLPVVTDSSMPDRTALTRTIVAWDETVKGLLERQRTFIEQSTRLLGMIHQGRPLSALPEDLSVPAIPYCTIAPLLNLLQNNHHSKPPPQQQQQQPATLGILEAELKDMARHPSPAPQTPPPQTPKTTPPPPLMTEPPPQVPLLSIPIPLMPQVLSGHPLFMHNGGGPPPVVSTLNYATGAIPKAAPIPQPSNQPSKAPEVSSPTQWTEPTNQLFVGQLPWEYTDADVKNLFSCRYGEVVSAAVYDKGYNIEGKLVPKYGFVTFRNIDDCLKALNDRPIYVGNHMLNVQAKEVKKPARPASVPTAGGGGGGGGAVGGGSGGMTIIGEPDAANGTKSSAYGLNDIPVNASVEANKSAAVHHNTLPTPPILHHQPPPPTQSVTKPKFQKLLPSNNTVGAIGTLPPKLVRPQSKTVPSVSKLGGQNNAAKDDGAMPSSSSSYTRLIEQCKQRFGKDFTSPEICTALRDVRTQNNNSLSGMNTEKILERVKHQLRSRKQGAGAPSVAPWASLTQGAATKTGPEWQGPSSEEAVKEESCSICLEPLNTSPTLPLQCLHTFHEHCIKGWLKRKSNCPNCRTFALTTDEYPTLTHS